MFSLNLLTVIFADKFGAIYMGPSTGPARTVPLIVWPHGGPHSMFVCDFKAEAAFFVLLGEYEVIAFKLFHLLGEVEAF